MHIPRSLRRLTPALALALVAALPACGGDGGKTDTASDPTPSEQVSERFTEAEVLAATEPYDVKPIYAVPRKLAEKYRLAYINPNPGFPFFKTMSDGYRAAAKFYGVELFEADLGNFNFADAVPKYEQLAVKQPQVVGILTPSGQALLERTKRDGVILLPSGIPIEGADHFIGTQNKQAGELGGRELGAAAKEKLAGDWQGRDVVYVGLAQQATSVTVERVQGGLIGVRASLPDLADGATFFPDLGKSATVDDGLRVMSDFLTAHPDEAVIVMAMNDEAGIGALQAVKRAGREGDVLIATVGGDELGRDTLREDQGQTLVALVDLNPFAAGWRWVEASIALLEGDEFTTPEIDRVLTLDNVDEYYPPTS